MKNCFLFMLSLGCMLWQTVPVCSQTLIERTCSSADYLQQAIQADPDYVQRLEAIERHTEDYVARHANDNERAVYTIPVVVHVVYNTSSQNISDAQIQTQMAVLNADFRKLNTDASSIPSIWTSIAADAEFEFCLAQRDPNGNPTNGITRTYTNTTAFSGDAVKGSANGKTPWDRSRYLNIWVCNLSGGLLGYATFPGGSASSDGVVVDYQCFGTNGTAAAPFNKGRTATHEVGHWMNLYHIWGDQNCGSDAVSDTPVHNNSNSGCPSQPHYSTCSGQPREMTMNYMDYTNDACMYMFTNGQKTRMRAIFATGGSRNSLLSSNGCVSPVSASCGTPSGLTTTNITATSARFNWAAVSGATSYSIQGRRVGSVNWTALTSTTNYYQLGSTALNGCNQYEWQVRSVCNGGVSNFSSLSTFTTTCSNALPSATDDTNLSTEQQRSITNDQLQLMPNPATDMVSLHFESTVSTPALIRIYDLSGRTVLSIPAYTDLGANQQSISVAALSAGYYVVEIDNGTQKWREKLGIMR